MTILEKILEKLKAAPPAHLREVLDFVEFLDAKTQRRPARPQRSWDDVVGSLKDSEVFAGDPVEIQRRLREEWD